MKQQHQEQQNLQQSTTSKLREAQVREVQKRYTVSSVQKIMGHSFILHWIIVSPSTLSKNDLEQVLRQIGDKDQKIQNLEALLQKSKENISLLEKEREDLYAKIQAGEGETAVLNQLQEKNHTLQEQVRIKINNTTEAS